MSELAQVLRPLLPADTPDALVDASTRDDAAVYRLSPDRALVVTVDFFTPVVDDPYDFGRIGAVNALSDVYAMGARPLFVLNLVGFPRKLLSTGALEEIIRGGSDVATEAGVPILGGHSIDDPEPKYGMVALGDVHPDRIITNAGARPGDLLVLTKPLGTGVVSTAIKAGAADPGEIDAAVRSMATLNRAASEAMITSGIQAATDITGYGLLGHLRNMMAHSGTKADIRMSDVPLLPGVRELAAAGAQLLQQKIDAQAADKSPLRMEFIFTARRPFEHDNKSGLHSRLGESRAAGPERVGGIFNPSIRIADPSAARPPRPLRVRPSRREGEAGA
jgi:selenide,water dikinase